MGSLDSETIQALNREGVILVERLSDYLADELEFGESESRGEADIREFLEKLREILKQCQVGLVFFQKQIWCLGITMIRQGRFIGVEMIVFGMHFFPRIVGTGWITSIF